MRYILEEINKALTKSHKILNKEYEIDVPGKELILLVGKEESDLLKGLAWHANPTEDSADNISGTIGSIEGFSAIFSINAVEVNLPTYLKAAWEPAL